MKSNEKIDSSAVGLDVGTSRIVAARRQSRNSDMRSSSTPSSTFVFEDDGKRPAEGACAARVEGSQIVVHGNEAKDSPTCCASKPGAPWTKGF